MIGAEKITANLRKTDLAAIQPFLQNNSVTNNDKWPMMKLFLKMRKMTTVAIKKAYNTGLLL